MAPALTFDSAPTEAATQVIRVVDVSAVLPSSRERSYSKRDPSKISEINLHQTEGNTKPPPGGLMATAEYFIAPDVDGKGSSGRGWPGFAYTFYVPFQPPRDADGRLVVYRCQPDDVRSYHTRDRDRVGVAIAFQGTFRSVDGGKGDPAPDQVTAGEALIRHLLDRYHLDELDLYAHRDWGKRCCPGSELEILIDMLRAAWCERAGQPSMAETPPRLTALAQLGLSKPDLSLSGNLKRLQSRLGFPVTGEWTRPVETFIRRQLLARKEKTP